MSETIQDGKFVELTYKVTDKKIEACPHQGRLPVGLRSRTQ